MKPPLLTFLLLLLSFCNYGQQEKADLLTCKKLLALTDSLVKTDYKRSYACAQQALAIGKKWNNDSIVSLAYRQLAAAVRSFRVPELYRHDSLSLLYAYKYKSPYMAFNSLQLYATDLLNDGQLQKADGCINEAIRLADSLRLTCFQTQVYMIRGAWLLKQLKPKEALAWYQRSLTDGKDCGDRWYITGAKLGIASAHIYMGRSDSASNYIFDAIEYYASIKDYVDWGESYDLLALSFQARGDMAKATEYYQQALQVFEQGKEPIKIADEYLAITRLLLAKRQFDEAKLYIQKADSLYRQTNNRLGISLAANHFGQYYTWRGMKDSASFFYGESKKIAQQLKQPLIELADNGYDMENKLLHGEKNDSIIAVTYQQAKAVFPAELVDTVAEKMTRQNKLSAAEKQQARLAFAGEATHFSLEEKALPLNPFTVAPASADSTIAFQYNTHLLEMEAKYKLRLKDDSLHRQADSLQAAHQQYQITQQQIQQKNLVIGVVALSALLLTLLAWQQYKNRKRADHFRKEEETSRLRAEENEATIKKLQKDVIHRVDNMLQQVNVLVSHTGKDSTDPGSFERLNSRLEPLNALYHIFKDNQLSEWVDMQVYLQEICDNIHFAFAAGDKVQLTVQAPCSIKNATAGKIGLIVNELVFNAFKYAFDKDKAGLIMVQLQQETGNAYHLTVKDNGRGLPIVINKGQGLSIIQELATVINGRLLTSSDNGAGFEIIFL